METVARQKSILVKQFNETRARTLSLVQTLEKDDFVVQTAPFMSPPKWHLGHVSWLLEVVMSKPLATTSFIHRNLVNTLIRIIINLENHMTRIREDWQQDPRLIKSLSIFTL